jgi:subtilisin
MKIQHRILFSLAAALLLVFSLAGSAFAESPKMVKVIIGWDRNTGMEEQTVGRYGGKVNERYHLVSATPAEIPESQIAILRKTVGVAYVEIDAVVTALAETVPWGVTSVKADQVQSTNKGAGIKVAVIDTGIQLNHPDLSVAGNVSFVSGVRTGNDDNGHGTHVAGTIAALNNGIGVIGVAPEASLYAVKVLDNTGSGYLSTVVSGIQWAVDNHMNIISMSLGSSSGSIVLQQACDQAYNAGILVVAAAGNSGLNSVGYPALYDSVLAVGAINSSNTRPSFSSTGSKVELAAPGVSIYSTYKGSAYATMSGTSMATPHVAGVAALVFAGGVKDTNGNGRVNDEVRSILDSTATDLGATGRDTEYGFGLVNAVKALNTQNNVPGPVPVPNTPPVANAGADQSISTNTLVTLNGSSSRDANGDTLSYLWSQISGPSVTISNAASVMPSFTALTAGNYVFQLTVSDGKASSSDRVTIVVTAPVTKGLRVQSITVSVVKIGTRTSATATVAVTDLNGAKVSSVSVKGHWAGGASGSVSGLTNSIGKVTFSTSVKNAAIGSTFTFVVDSLSKTGYTYNAARNLESSDSAKLNK